MWKGRGLLRKVRLKYFLLQEFIRCQVSGLKLLQHRLGRGGSREGKSCRGKRFLL